MIAYIEHIQGGDNQVNLYFLHGTCHVKVSTNQHVGTFRPTLSEAKPPPGIQDLPSIEINDFLAREFYEVADQLYALEASVGEVRELALTKVTS